MQANVISRSLVPRGPAQDMALWVDVSSKWGLGVILNDHWAAWRLRPGWRTEGRDIGWAKTVALELAFRLLESKGIRDVDVIVRSDNQGSIGAYLKGRGQNFHSNLSIRRMGEIGAACNVQLVPSYVPPAENLADPISRGILGSPFRRIPWEIQLPLELEQFLLYV